MGTVVEVFGGGLAGGLLDLGQLLFSDLVEMGELPVLGRGEDV